MGVITTLFTMEKATFYQYKKAKKLSHLMDIMYSAPDDTAPFEFESLYIDKAWFEFKPIWWRLMPDDPLRDTSVRINYNHCDVTYWGKASDFWALRALRTLSGEHTIKPPEQMETAFSKLKDAIKKSAADPEPWLRDDGDPFYENDLDYVYEHMCRAIKFVTEQIKTHNTDLTLVRISE